MKTKHNVLEFSMLCFVLINSVILNLFFVCVWTCETQPVLEFSMLFYFVLINSVWILNLFCVCVSLLSCEPFMCVDLVLKR